MLLVSTTRIIPGRAVPSFLSGRYPAVKVRKKLYVTALYQIAVTRMSYDQRTKDYVGKRKRDGKSKKEAIRCLKRYIAREVFRALRNPLEIKGPSWKDLRPARQALGITLVEAGKALNVGFQRVSYAETGRLMNVRFLEEYDAWLKSQAKRES